MTDDILSLYFTILVNRGIKLVVVNCCTTALGKFSFTPGAVLNDFERWAALVPVEIRYAELDNGSGQSTGGFRSGWVTKFSVLGGSG